MNGSDGWDSGVAEWDSPAERTPALRPLDMFLLGLVKGGLITPYDWQARGRVSLGASLPAVQRLLKAGLLTKVRKGPRGRHEFGLTVKGEEEIRYIGDYVQRAIKELPSDLESTVRLASLATLVKNVKTAKAVWQAAYTARERARVCRKRPNSSDSFRSRLAGLYSIVLARCEAQQQTALANELTRLHRNWETETEEILRLWDHGRRSTR